MNEPMRRTIKLAALLLGILLLAPTLQAAPEPAKTTQLDGDVITYISKTGVMTAKGGVKLTQGNAVMTGDSGEYNTKTKEAVMTGNVKAVKEDSTLTAAQVRSYDDMKRLVATGDALLVRKDSTAAVSDHAVYYGINGKNGKADLTGNVRVIQDGNVLTGNHVVMYLDDSAMDTEGRSKLVIQPKKTAPAPGNNNAAPEKEKP